MKKWLFLIAAIVLEVSGSLSLKAALEAPAFYLIVVAGYAGSFSALFMSLRKGMNLGVGYGIWSATGVALTTILSNLIFNEPITPVIALGIVLVMGGVLIVEIGSHSAQKKVAGSFELDPNLVTYEELARKKVRVKIPKKKMPKKKARKEESRNGKSRKEMEAVR